MSKHIIFYARYLLRLIFVVAIIILCIVFGAKYYLSSDFFTAFVNQKILQEVGKDIVISGPVTWDSFYPEIRVNVNKIEFQEPAAEGRTSRVRLRNTAVKLPARILRQQNHISDLVLHIDHAAVVIEKSAANESARVGIADILAIIERVQAPPITALDIVYADVIDRRGTEPTHYRAKNIQLDLGHAGLNLRGSFAVGAKDSIPLSVVLEKDTSQQQPMYLLDARVQSSLQGIPQEIVLTSSLAFDSPRLKITGLRIEKNKNLITGDLIYDAKDNALNGSFVIKRLELTDVLSPTNRSKKGDKVLSRVTFPYDILTRVSTNIKIQAGAVRYSDAPLVNGTFVLNAQDGQAEILGSGLSVLGAPTTLAWSAKNLASNPSFSVALTTEQLALGRLNLFANDDQFFRDGIGNLSVNLTYTGTSLKDHTTSSLGILSLNAVDGHISPTFVQWLDKSIVSRGKQLATEDKAHANQTEDEGVSLPCVNIFFALNNGYAAANKSILIETADNMFVSSGFIDFHTEKIGFTFSSSTKKAFDWSPLSTAKYIQLDGTLASPAISLNPQETLKKGMLTASSFIFGPVPALAYAALEAAQNQAQDRPKCLPHRHLVHQVIQE